MSLNKISYIESEEKHKNDGKETKSGSFLYSPFELAIPMFPFSQFLLVFPLFLIFFVFVFQREFENGTLKSATPPKRFGLRKAIFCYREKWGCSSDSLRYHRKHSATGHCYICLAIAGGISVGSLTAWRGVCDDDATKRRSGNDRDRS